MVARLVERNGYAPEEIRKRIASQMSSEERSRRANEVITNFGRMSDLEETVKEIWERRVERRIEQT